MQIYLSNKLKWDNKIANKPIYPTVRLINVSSDYIYVM